MTVHVTVLVLDILPSAIAGQLSLASVVAAVAAVLVDAVGSTCSSMTCSRRPRV
jgi:hypothetical protein